ncbi:hypothetical protein ACO0LC_11315 [Undibacterium sp. JH2W]|uniref:hypothetical protein n=1 Tax=Undibacterium sp. JH2W TaxID=3413037 RepID=UPI003BF28D51
MTDPIFDFQRFARLLRAHWAESWREYAWFAAALAMLDLIFMAIFLSGSSGNSFLQFKFESQVAWYMTGLFLSALIFAGRYFKYLLNPGASLIALMRPASVFEKWLMAFLFISIFYPLAYTLLYILLNYPAVQLARSMAAQGIKLNFLESDYRFYIPFLTTTSVVDGGRGARIFLTSQQLFFILLNTAQALMAGGTAFFKRSPVLSTLLVSFLLFVFFTLAGVAPKLGIFALDYDDIVQHNTLEYALSVTLWLGLPVLLWAALFFHIKERELA